MHDAHFHLSDCDEFHTLVESGIINAHDKNSFKQAQKYRSPKILISFGLHPWYNYASMNEYKTYFQQCDIIGEIGMDCVWSHVSLDKQKQLFIEQLKLAQLLNKAVILHTKGCEKEIAEIISMYPNIYLVHWYSADCCLQQYIEQDCYFTIGPSVVHDINVQSCAKQVPLNRLLLESDGLEALYWARGMTISYDKAMYDSLFTIAKLRNLEVSVLEKILDKNFIDFVNKVVILK